MAISTTLFLFIHTRELHTKLKAMEVKLQPEDMLSGKCAPNPFDSFRALIPWYFIWHISASRTKYKFV
jgi:hypothetical protein